MAKPICKKCGLEKEIVLEETANGLREVYPPEFECPNIDCGGNLRLKKK